MPAAPEVDDFDPQQAEREAEQIERDDGGGKERSFPCRQCGANLVWHPGQRALQCPYCNTQHEAPADARAIREFAFNDVVAMAKREGGLGVRSRSVRCGGCGAVIDMSADQSVRACTFCGSTVLDEQAHEQRIAPEAVIPFAIERADAVARWQAWLKGLWFAPSSLAREAEADALGGVYRAWWTFDSRTTTHWEGYAGFHYYTGSGKNRRRHTRWVYRSGIYEKFFDDWLTPGFAKGLRAQGYRLTGLVPYQPQMLAGFVCERYVIGPQAAWHTARAEIEGSIHQACSRALGGDTQRGLTCRTAHCSITCKSVLLPVWQGCYRYRGRTFHIAVNGQTGTVSGDRPWSAIKIIMTVLVVLAVIGGIILAVTKS